ALRDMGGPNITQRCSQPTKLVYFRVKRSATSRESLQYEQHSFAATHSRIGLFHRSSGLRTARTTRWNTTMKKTTVVLTPCQNRQGQEGEQGRTGGVGCMEAIQRRCSEPGIPTGNPRLTPFSRDAESSERSAWAGALSRHSLKGEPPRAPLRRLRVAAKRDA